LADLGRTLPGASADAWNEFERNTLDDHADAFPDSWDGVLSVDDECASYYSATPATCGTGLSTSYDTQIPNQPAYSLFDILHLAGLTDEPDGYQVIPAMPMSTFTVRFPDVGIAQQPGILRGYITPVEGGSVTMAVALPPGVSVNGVQVFVEGRPVPHFMSEGLVTFVMRTVAGQPSDWAVR